MMEIIINTILSGYNQRIMSSQVLLDQIQDFLQLLEISLYIQYYVDYQSRPAEDGWLKHFFTDR